MLSLADAAEWFASFRVICEERSIFEGFTVGLALGLVLPLGIAAVTWVVLRRRRSCGSVCLESEGGNLTLSAQAIRDFLQRIVAEFSDVELLGVALHRRNRLTDIRLRVNAVPLASVRRLKDSLKQRVRSELADKLGLEELLGDVHIDVVRYCADERRIARKAAKCRRPEPAPRRPPAYPPYAGEMAFGGRGEDDGTA